MANQPPSRPLFRLPNLGRQAPPPPAPPAAAEQPQPRPSPPQQARPPVIRPAFAQSIRPTQPQARPPQPQLPPTTTTTTTPPQPPAITPSSTPPLTPPRTATAPTPSPLASPSPPPSRPVATPQPPAALSLPSPASPPRAEFISNQSSKMSPMLSSPSPRKPQVSEELPPPPAAAASSLDSMTLTYPSKSSSYPETMSRKSSAAAQSAKTYTRSSPPISLPPQSKEPKVELKNVMVQAIYSKQPISTMKEADRRMLSSYSEDDRNVKVLNVGDKTKGVNMEVGVSLRINRGRKHDFVGTANFNGNGNVGNEARESDGSLRKGIGKASRLPIEAFVNSNIQGINSSILHDCSVTHRDPGVHFHLSKKPINGD